MSATRCILLHIYEVNDFCTATVMSNTGRNITRQSTSIFGENRCLLCPCFYSTGNALWEHYTTCHKLSVDCRVCGHKVPASRIAEHNQNCSTLSNIKEHDQGNNFQQPNFSIKKPKMDETNTIETVKTNTSETIKSNESKTIKGTKTIKANTSQVTTGSIVNNAFESTKINTPDTIKTTATETINTNTTEPIKPNTKEKVKNSTTETITANGNLQKPLDIIPEVSNPCNSDTARSKSERVEHKCLICSSVCSQMDGLEQHYRSVHKVVDVTCGKCGQPIVAWHAKDHMVGICGTHANKQSENASQSSQLVNDIQCQFCLRWFSTELFSKSELELHETLCRYKPDLD